MERITLEVTGQVRESLIRTSRETQSPLVIVLHGAGGTAEWADGETGWSALAAREGFALALPEAIALDPGKPPRFLTNPQRCNDHSSGPTADPSNADDVAFLAALIDIAVSQYGVDRRRVFLTGFSNGAGMAFRAAAELADRLAAVAPVAGYCHDPRPSRPSRPVPTLYIIGDADPLVPLRGGEVLNPWVLRLDRRPPVVESLERWAKAIGCEPRPRTESDANGVRIEVFPGPVEFRVVTIEGLGHHWPGGKGQLNHKIAGLPSDRFSATEEIWRFFSRHSFPSRA
jgi:polyhydroxybutyrate depolymerase